MCYANEKEKLTARKVPSFLEERTRLLHVAEEEEAGAYSEAYELRKLKLTVDFLSPMRLSRARNHIGIYDD